MKGETSGRSLSIGIIGKKFYFSLKSKFTMKYSIYLFAIVFLAFSSCSKKDDTVSRSTHIATTTWTLDVIGLDIDNNGSIDSDLPPGIIEQCQIDNILSFRSDHTGTMEEGALKCDVDDPQTREFTWSLSADEKTITIPEAVLGDISGVIKIISVNETEFVISKEIAISSPVPMTFYVVARLVH